MNSTAIKTIIARCTPEGSGALAIIRLSGPQAFNIGDQIAQLQGRKTFATSQSHTISFGRVVDAGNIIDQVIFLCMKAPRTFTGEDTLEIICHNNSFLIEQIIKVSIKHGALPAGPGEFTQQAVLNNKIDLIQAEAIHDLITAQSEAALKKSVAQLEGSLSRFMIDLEERLIKALAWCEASFEFLDDEGDFSKQLCNQIEELLGMIEKALISFNQQKHLKEGIRIALIGSVNAGKSSLFNALIGHQRAIVSAQAGTTRDSIEANLVKKGLFWTLIDTAGLRQTDDMIEQEGIQRSYLEAQKADIILLVQDSSREQSSQEMAIYSKISQNYSDNIISVGTKMDLIQDPSLASPYNVQLSTQTLQGLSELEEALQVKIETLSAQHTLPFLLNKRHYHLLESVAQELTYIVSMLTAPSIQYELISIHLKSSLMILSQLTGKSVSEAGLNQVFKEFCVGK